MLACAVFGQRVKAIAGKVTQIVECVSGVEQNQPPACLLLHVDREATALLPFHMRSVSVVAKVRIMG